MNISRLMARSAKTPLARFILFFFFHFSFLMSSASAQPLMRDVFAAMPDSVLPMVSRNNRLDCIDFIENQMEARVRNALGEYVTLEALTADYLRFRTSSSSLLEMKLLPASDSTSVLCLVRTAQAGEAGSSLRLEDSNIRFLRPDWTELPTPPVPLFEQPCVETFFVQTTVPDSLLAEFHQARRSLQALHPVRLSLSPDAPTLTLTLQTALLSQDEKRAARDRLQPLVCRWNGSRFE